MITTKMKPREVRVCDVCGAQEGEPLGKWFNNWSQTFIGEWYDIWTKTFPSAPWVFARVRREHDVDVCPRCVLKAVHSAFAYITPAKKDGHNDPA